jgi:hypothetical protein
MIGNVVSHGRSGRDARNLCAHLLKMEMNERVAVRIENMLSTDLPSSLRDMQLMRDGTRADAAFLHISISPGRQMTDAEVHRAGDIVLRHLGMAENGCARVLHDKPRVAGEGGTHLHLVVARVGPDGAVARAGLDKIKVETACRLAEFELGEAPTLGRHHRSAIRYFEKARPEVAAWLTAGFGPQPELPRSAVTPDQRRVLDRKGVDFRGVREVVKEAWARSDGPQALRAALSEQGLTVLAGDKPGAWIVRRGDEFVGALDRLAKQKRAEVSAFMEKQQHDPAPAPAAGPSISRDDPRPDQQGGPDRVPDARPRPDPGGSAPAREPGGTGREPGAHDAGTGAAGPHLPDRDAAPDRRPARRARTAAIEVARADRRPRARDLRAAAARIAAQASPAYADALHELDRRAEDARARMTQAAGPLEPSASLADARRRAAKAREAAREAEDRERKLRAALEAAEAGRPRGVLAWISGKAAAAERQIQTLEKDLRAATEDVRIRRVVRGGADQKEDREARAHAEAEAEHRRRQDGLQRLGRMDLARVDRLRRALEAQPGWAAHGVDALSQHIDRADAVRRAEEAQRREEERRRQEAEDRTHRPRGPTR